MRNHLNDTDHIKEQFLPLTYLHEFDELLFGTQTIGQRIIASQNQQHFILDSPWSIIRQNAEAICSDETTFLNNPEFRVNPDELRKKGKHNLIIHHSARIEDCYFNTADGPIIIDENALLMGASAFRGPIYIGKKSVVKMGATIYGGTTIGPHCIIGGEVKNTIFQGYSNKGHHGYIGDSFIGTWCNLGAGTSCSNVKNTGGIIKSWNIHKKVFESAGTKCGVLMGDFCRTAINTAINSGSVMGIFANVYDAQTLSPKFIPSFSWGTNGQTYEEEKILGEMMNWMALKEQTPDQQLIENILSLYHQTDKS